MRLPFKIICTKVHTGDYRSYIDTIISWSSNRLSKTVCVSNVHMLVEAYWDTNFNNSLNSADMVTPDGMPLVFALKWLYGIKQDRVSGMDLLPELLKQAEAKHLKLFFYGGTDEMLEHANNHIRINYPSLLDRVAYYSPPFRQLSAAEEDQIVERINQFQTNLVFVVLGCPKQEKWLISMKGRINAVMIGIGGALPVMVGLQKRAPIWMQKASLEWLFRLIQEPKRLFKRYFVTNSVFIFLLCKHKIQSLYKN